MHFGRDPSKLHNRGEGDLRTARNETTTPRRRIHQYQCLQLAGTKPPTAMHTAEKFPNDPALVRLLAGAKRVIDLPSAPSIVDLHLHISKDYGQLLADILQTRRYLLEVLAPPNNSQGIFTTADSYIAIVTNSGYEFIVAFFAIRAVGGTPLPLASGILPEEAEYFFLKANCTCIVAGRDQSSRAADICAFSRQSASWNKKISAVSISTDAEPIGYDSISIDETLLMKPDGPGLVLFTSGTTGRPKGVVLPRLCFTQESPGERGGTTFSCRPGNWFGGAKALVESVLAGQSLVILGEKKGRARAEATLDVFRDHKITNAVFTPELLRQLKVALLERTNNGLANELSPWAARFSNLSFLRCATGAAEPAMIQFWTGLSGCPIENNYGATELGGGVTIGISRPQRTSANQVVGAFSYLNDEKLTTEAFDKDGYFKTGDIAELKGGEYFYEGRANVDFIQFNIFKIPALSVESCLLGLGYVSEACVLAVPHNDAKNLCGAIVRLSDSDDAQRSESPLTRIRHDLADTLAPYMLPLLLHILTDDQVLPRTASGKLQKRDALKTFFDATPGNPITEKDLPPAIERWASVPPQQAQIKAWDWGGMQRC
ncbi:hypothetical protein PWT90_06613 [Aphanocladium album]|nr:hypothetical protein PWT90_06613 [Aphanocladium album]